MSEQTNPYSNGSTIPEGEEILAPLPNDGGLIDADAWMHEEVNRAPKAEPQYSLETGEVEKVIVNPNNTPVSDVPTWAGGGAPWNNGPEPIADSNITLPADDVEPQMPARRSVFNDIKNDNSPNAVDKPIENTANTDLSTESTSMVEPSEPTRQPAPMPTVPIFASANSTTTNSAEQLENPPTELAPESPNISESVPSSLAAPDEQMVPNTTPIADSAHIAEAITQPAIIAPADDLEEVVYHSSLDESAYSTTEDSSSPENTVVQNENEEIEHTKVAMAVTESNLSEENLTVSETPDIEPVYGINPDALVANNTGTNWPNSDQTAPETVSSPNVAPVPETTTEHAIEIETVPAVNTNTDATQFAKNTTNWSEDSSAEDPFSVDLTPKSRLASHLWGLLLALLLPPLLWYLVSDGATRLTSQEIQPWEAGIDWIALLELIGSILLVVVLIIVASASSAGVITFGTIFTLVGIIPIILPSISYNFLTSFFAPLNNLGNFGANINHYLMTTLFNGTFIFFGLFLLAIGVVSHRARRAGRYEGELKQKIAYAEKNKTEA